MLPPLPFESLLGARSHLDKVVDNIRAGYRGQYSGPSAATILLILAAVAGLAALAWGASRLFRRRQARRQATPKWLFDELCKAHRVESSDRRLLWAAAIEQHPENPSLLFIEPDSLRPHKLKFRRRVEIDRLAAVAGRIYGDLLPKADAAPGGAKPKPPAATPLRNPPPSGGIDVRKALS